ncbi:MAG: hypothetical protein DRP01_00505 [Archaeoglobales archaeon]|nr:MAG: hypothetical protein DRP01_00505 [Archaeoglobales archaeon]
MKAYIIKVKISVPVNREVSETSENVRVTTIYQLPPEDYKKFRRARSKVRRIISRNCSLKIGGISLFLDEDAAKATLDQINEVLKSTLPENVEFSSGLASVYLPSEISLERLNEVIGAIKSQQKIEMEKVSEAFIKLTEEFTENLSRRAIKAIEQASASIIAREAIDKLRAAILQAAAKSSSSKEELYENAMREYRKIRKTLPKSIRTAVKATIAQLKNEENLNKVWEVAVEELGELESESEG